jgi:GNAT superfamily N-acetyltransferase
MSLADPTGALWEAADFQWCWRRDQHPDPSRQLFWLDRGTPVAAVVFTNWGDYLQYDPLVAPELRRDLMDAVWDAGWERIEALGDMPVEITLRDGDFDVLERLSAAGFQPTGEVTVTTTLTASDRPAVPGLPDGFRLVPRSETSTEPHHMIGRNGVSVAERLRECSLYRTDLDLGVIAPNGDVAGYALFWADPVTAVGLVEPMRVEAAYYRRGIGRHLLAAGLDRLASAGCSLLKVTYHEGKEPARRLYLGAGFHPQVTCRAYRRSRPSQTVR